MTDWCERKNRECKGSCEEEREKSIASARRAGIKIYVCSKEFCPYEDDKRFTDKFEDRKWNCMFGNGLSMGMCDHSGNKQEGVFQRGIGEWM